MSRRSRGVAVRHSGKRRSMDAKKVGEAGLIGLRGRLARRAADAIGKRTRLDPERIAMLLGSYLFLSRTRRMLQMLGRMRRGR